jgi:hypothetical protein
LLTVGNHAQEENSFSAADIIDAMLHRMISDDPLGNIIVLDSYGPSACRNNILIIGEVMHRTYDINCTGGKRSIVVLIGRDYLTTVRATNTKHSSLASPEGLMPAIFARLTRHKDEAVNWSQPSRCAV